MHKNLDDAAADPTADRVRKLLARHRAGDPQAASDLISHFLPLAELFIGRHLRGLGAHPRLEREDLQQQVYLDLAEAVDRLSRNDTGPDDVESYIAGYLTHSLAHLLRAETQDVLASPSQRRRRKGPTMLKRRRGRYRLDSTAARDANDQNDIDALRDPRAADPRAADPRLRGPGLTDPIDPRVSPLEDPSIDTPHRPSRFDQQTPDDIAQDNEELEMQRIQAADIMQRMPRVARTPLEKSVAGMLAGGMLTRQQRRRRPMPSAIPLGRHSR